MSILKDRCIVAAIIVVAALMACTFWRVSRYETTATATRETVVFGIVLALAFLAPLAGQVVRRRVLRLAFLVASLCSWALLAALACTGTAESWSYAAMLYGWRFMAVLYMLVGSCLALHLLISVRLA